MRLLEINSGGVSVGSMNGAPCVKSEARSQCILEVITSVQGHATHTRQTTGPVSIPLLCLGEEEVRQVEADWGKSPYVDKVLVVGGPYKGYVGYCRKLGEEP